MSHLAFASNVSLITLFSVEPGTRWTGAFELSPSEWHAFPIGWAVVAAILARIDDLGPLAQRGQLLLAVFVAKIRMIFPILDVPIVLSKGRLFPRPAAHVARCVASFPNFTI